MENEILEPEILQPRFISEVTHDLPTRKEVNKLYALLHLGTILREGMVSVVLLVLFGYLFCYTGNQAYYGRTVFVITLFYWGAFLIKLFQNRGGGQGYKQMLRRNGGNPVHNRITFTEEAFQVENTYTGEVNEYIYERIRRIAQSQNFLLLYREMNQCTVVSKKDLEGGTAEDLLDYLREKNCFAPMKTPKPGLIVRWTGYVIWVLSLALAIYTQVM